VRRLEPGERLLAAAGGAGEHVARQVFQPAFQEMPEKPLVLDHEHPDLPW